MTYIHTSVYTLIWIVICSSYVTQIAIQIRI